MGSYQGSVSSLSFTQFLTDVLPSPRNPKELFNLRHALARNVVEWIFGILKRRFRILRLSTEYDMSIQVMIPPALAALHNFIQQYDPEEIHEYDDEAADPEMDHDHQASPGALGVGLTTPAETLRANERRDKIAHEMWEQYQQYLQTRHDV